MGLFDFFKGKGAASGDAQEKTLMRHAERVLDKRAMSPDRFASIEYLARLGTEEAWRALLPRYNFTVDPTITDREEKAYRTNKVSAFCAIAASIKARLAVTPEMIFFISERPSTCRPFGQ
jgi:hypothetical protein